MSDSPYPEGWPRYVGGGYLCEFEALQVVPLSDAERMREALESVLPLAETEAYWSRSLDAEEQCAEARAALNPERGE